MMCAGAGHGTTRDDGEAARKAGTSQEGGDGGAKAEALEIRAESLRRTVEDLE